MAVTFDNLWSHHPTGENPCTTRGKSNFDNQCAIRIGVALAKCGYDVTRLQPASTLKFCWHHPKSEGHILRAEELANALDKTRIPNVSATTKITQTKDFATTLRGKKASYSLRTIGRDPVKPQTEQATILTYGMGLDLLNGQVISEFSGESTLAYQVIGNLKKCGFGRSNEMG